MKQFLKASLIVAGLARVALGGPVGPPGGPPIFNQDFPQFPGRFNVSSATVRDALYIRYLVPGLCQTTDSNHKVINIPCGGGGASTLGVNWDGVQVTSPTIAINAVSPIIVTAVSGGTTAQFSLDPSSVTLAGQAVIKLRDVLQSGATLYVSSGTILNLITQNLVANSASFPNGLTANGTIVGNAQLQMFGLSTFFGPVLSANYGYTMPDGSVMTSTSNFVWNSAIPQTATLNITSATIRTQLSLPYLTPSQCLTTDSAGRVTSQGCGTGTAIVVSTGGSVVSAVTGQLDFNGSQFIASLLAATTPQISLNGSSVTLQGNQFSLAGMAGSISSLGASTGTLSGSTTTVQNQVNTHTTQIAAIGVTTGSLQTQINGKGVGTITGVVAGLDLNGGGTANNVTLNLSPGSTQYINNSPIHQAMQANIDSMTVHGPVAVGSFTVTSGSGIWDYGEALLGDGQVGADAVQGSSVTHMLMENPNNQGWHGLVMSSITAPTTGGLAAWSAPGKLRDIGPPPWVVVPSTFAWNFPFPVVFSSGVTIAGGSTTIVGAVTHTGYSTATLSNAFYDYSASSVAIGFLRLGNGYGTAGQVATSGGGTSSATWATVSGGGGGGGGASLTSPNLFTASQTFTASGNSVTNIIGVSSSTNANPYFAVSTGGVVSVGGNAAFSYRQSAPQYPFDYECSSLDPANCLNISHSNGTAISASGAGNSPTILASNNNAGTNAPAIKASKIGVSGTVADFETDQATSVFANATTGTALRANSGSGNAIQVDQGNSVLRGGVNISGGITLNGTLITSSSTITSSMSVVYASCTTRGASPNAWITLMLPSAPAFPSVEWHRIYNVGADSCSIRVAGSGTDLIESTGLIKLDAQMQHAYLESAGVGLWGGNIQYTPWSVFTTQDDVAAWTVATASDVYSCPVNITAPGGFEGFRVGRTGSGTGLFSFALTDMFGKYLVGVSSAISISGVNNYTTGGVYQVSPGWYRVEVMIPNTVTAITGGNSEVSNKIFCSKVGNAGTSGVGGDLSMFTPTIPGTGDTRNTPSIHLLFNGGMLTY